MYKFNDLNKINLPDDLSDLKLQLDMDGVVANFIDTYLDLAERIGKPYVGCKYDNTNNPELFRTAVLDHSIFSVLPLMPFAHEIIELISVIKSETGLQVEILSSVNSHDPLIIKAASEQKKSWLLDYGISWKPNFVSSNEDKAKFANPNSLLLDDMDHCIVPFAKNGGYTLKYIYFDDFFKKNLFRILNKMHENKILNAS